ncbi:MAG: fibronectin type III domain-containing protein [Firmicutes bacterium]|nr:fibronectin type III domain-containing protein [Bacillota bacterium]
MMKSQTIKIMNNSLIIVIISVFLVGASCFGYAYGKGNTTDITAPTIDALVIRNADNIDAQGEMTIEIDITEDESGLGQISLQFVNELGHVATIKYETFDAPLFSGSYVIKIPIENRLANGEYTLTTVDVIDINENPRLCEIEGETINVVNSTLDGIPPVINSISILNPEEVDAGEDLVIDIDFTEENGINEILLIFVRKEGHGTTIRQPIDPPLTTGRYTIAIPLNNEFENGNYSLQSVSVFDGNSYGQFFNNSEDEYVINVINSTADATYPVINSIELQTHSITLPGVLHIKVDFEETDNPYWIGFSFRNEEGHEIGFMKELSSIESGQHTFDFLINPFEESGTYSLLSAAIEDKMGNHTVYCLNKEDFEGISAQHFMDLSTICENRELILKSAFEVSFYKSSGAISSLLESINNAEEGSVGIIDCRTNTIIPKEVFEAIAGKNITLVFQDEDIQWVFEGLKVKKEKCKDIDLATNIHGENGKNLGYVDDSEVLVIDFMDNGELPGEATVRISDAFISAKYMGGTKHLMLSYVDGNCITVEDTNVIIEEDEAAVLKITHNSRYILSSGPLSIDDAKVSVSNCIYNGDWLNPSVTVTLNGKKLDSKYYTKKYDNNKNVGTATVKVSGRESFGYKGEASGTFHINPKKAVISKVSVGQKKIIVAMSTKPSATGGTTYKIEYRVAGQGSWKSTTTTSNTRTIQKLQAGKKYQVRVKAYKGARVGAVSATKTSAKVLSPPKVKKANPITVTTTTKKVKASKVKKAAQTVKAITVSKAKGTVTYSKVSGAKKLTVNKKTGKITVKKKTKKGTYKIKVKVKAAGTANYAAKTKTVQVKIRVK